MVKVGDTVISVSDISIDIKIGNKYVVTGVGEYVIKFNDDAGHPRKRSTRDYRVISSTTPPQKITQNGYEYSLVGPVKPEWLVDGAWVVSRITGKLYKVLQVSNCKFQAVNSDGTNNSGNLTSEEFSSAYRPHTASDWKWGDWAMYAGRKVFVIERGNWKGDIRVSHPDLPDMVDYVPVLQLTPTF